MRMNVAAIERREWNTRTHRLQCNGKYADKTEAKPTTRGHTYTDTQHSTAQQRSRNTVTAKVLSIQF